MYYLQVIGGPVNDELHVELYRKAHRILSEGKKKLRLSGDGFEGVLRTRFESYSIGTFAGMAFEAELDVDDISIPSRLTFLFRDEGPIPEDGEVCVLQEDEDRSPKHTLQ